MIPVPDSGSIQAPAGIVPDQGSIQPPPEPSTLEAFHRGAYQGSTFGFGDEISGAIGKLFGNKEYAAGRDTARQADTAAQEAHPFAYGGGELAGSLATPIPGAGAAKGAGVLAKAGEAAAVGGLAGLGASHADLTKGDFHGAVTDTIKSALVGGAIGGTLAKGGKLLGKAGAKADDQTIRALAGAESKTSGASWQKTRRMVNNPETKSILREPVQVETDAGKQVTTSLEQVAGKEPDAIKNVVEAQTAKIGEEIRPIYAKADAKNGGVKLSDYIKHLDDQIAKTADMAPAEAKVYRNALGELKENALEQWGHKDLPAALATQEAKNPAVQQAIMKSLDATVPSEAVRSEATALQKIGFKTVDPLNPGLSTQVKRDMGNMVRDFVNDHVMQTLGGEDHSTLLSLNKRMNAWLGVGTVAEARAEMERAGRISGRGGIAEMLGHGSMMAGLAGAAMGHPAALLAPVATKVLGQAPAAIRGATRAAAGIDRRLKAVADAAASGNPFAQQLMAKIKAAPGGIARVAALQQAQPVETR